MLLKSAVNKATYKLIKLTYSFNFNLKFLIFILGKFFNCILIYFNCNFVGF